jgi:dihydroorotate dehydrogenase (NAD+) catalytic subunit
VWLSSYPGYALSPLRALHVRRVLKAVRRYGQHPLGSGASR